MRSWKEKTNRGGFRSHSESLLESMEKKVFWQKQYRCGLCGAEFRALRIFDKAIRLKQRDLFLRAIYDYPDPQHYAIIVCPECFYSAFDKDYAAMPEKLNAQRTFQLQNALKKAKESLHLSLAEDRTLKEVIDIYSLAVVTYRIAEEPFKMAQLYLKLGWFYLEDNNRDKAAIALSKSYGYFLETYERGRVSEEADGILFCLASIQIFLKNVSEGFRWLERLTQDYKNTNSPYLTAGKALWEDFRGKKT